MPRFVYIDGEYVDYDDELHGDLDTFTMVIGFVATSEQVQNLDSGEYMHINVLNEKSAPVLRMMRDKTMDTMGEAVADACIEDLMDISPDNIFDQPTIKGSTINDLGVAMRDMMSNMTIGTLMDWANITSVDPMVKCVIQDVTFEAFLNSLTYDELTGNLAVDMEVLYA